MINKNTKSWFGVIITLIGNQKYLEIFETITIGKLSLKISAMGFEYVSLGNTLQ